MSEERAGLEDHHETDPAAGLLNAVQQTIGVAALGPVFLGSP